MRRLGLNARLVCRLAAYAAGNAAACAAGTGLLWGTASPAFTAEPAAKPAAKSETKPQALSDAVAPGRADWHTDFDAAQAEANRLGLPLLAHFYADWCGPCRAMESSVLNAAEVRGVLGVKCVAVKVNIEHRRDVASRFGVSALPTDVFVGPDGKVLGRGVGGSSRGGYVAKIEQVGREFAGVRPDPLTQLTKLADGGGVGVGLEGFSPVSLTADKLWRKGDPAFACKHAGVMYHLADAAELAKFKASPDRYAPRYCGFDPLILSTEKVAVAGEIHYGSFFENRLYLHATEENRQAFLKEPRSFPLPPEVKPGPVLAARRAPVEAEVPTIAGS